MKYHYFLPNYSIFSHIPLTKVDPNVDITFFLTLTKFLSLNGLIDSLYVDRNNHLSNVTFALFAKVGKFLTFNAKLRPNFSSIKTEVKKLNKTRWSIKFL